MGIGISFSFEVISIHAFIVVKKVLEFSKEKGIQKYIQYRFSNSKWHTVMTWYKRNKLIEVLPEIIKNVFKVKRCLKYRGYVYFLGENKEIMFFFLILIFKKLDYNIERDI